ncbi:WavE lipopolysaccharide synthesis family protein [Butyrivibrio sp. INlla14]|uniref:WavE lipopolysaccharide synthesis family protein n=1 Tax=Butyrivibrio sp. INlla14 TaxID=1520808 RepID=UPI0008773D10|nr:WavE lipopolysaccharide synthesis family protein [Butyrivibrio sp. INlla14]SCY71446.1 WavE lipopolysaccharide synthesis [Butyrivibrio sp. INlla14]
MKQICLREMKKGYFIGDFEPNILRSKDVEICIRGASKYTLDAAYYRRNDKRVIYINQGKIDIDGRIFGKGDAIMFEPGEVINIFALTNVEMIAMNFPGTKGDLCRVVWDDVDRMDAFYNSYLQKLIAKHDQKLLSNNKSGISSKDITVIIQGYFDRNVTPNTIRSVRKYLPEARVIVSTWEECDCKGVDCDLLIKSNDPGACECGLYADFPISNNGNRQIVSTKAGLGEAKTKFTLKLRSDLVLLDNSFLDYFDEYPLREEQFSIFEHKIIIGELFTRNDFVYRDTKGKRHRVAKPFHPSDWFYFGLTKDIKQMYDNVDLIPQEEMAGYECKYPDRAHKNKYKYSWRYTTEQHVFLGCVRNKFGDIKFDDWTDWSDETVSFSEKVMMNNFVILDFCQHRILNTKYAPESFANSGVYYKEEALMTNKQMVNYFEKHKK